MTTPFDAAAVDIANTVNRLKEYAYERIQVNYDEALRARRMETKFEKMYTVARKELVDAKAKVSELQEALNLRDKGVELTLSRIAELEAALAARDGDVQVALAKIAELEAGVAARDDAILRTALEAQEDVLAKVAEMETALQARDDALAKVAEMETAIQARDDALAKVAELETMLSDAERPAKRSRHDAVADATFDHVVLRNRALYYCMADDQHPPTQTTMRIVERYRCREGAISGTYSMYYLQTPGGVSCYRSKKAVVNAMLVGEVPNYPQQA